MKNNIKNQDQRGIASILTVIFFTIVVSIITLGFLRIALQEGEQTLEDDLSKSAYAAAYSGVNDAKRAILYCAQNPTADGCDELNDQECPGFFNSPLPGTGLAAALGISQDTRGSVIVGDPTLDERYTCVTIRNNTEDVSGQLQENATTLIPLKAVGGTFSSVRISWHEMGGGTNPSEIAINGNPHHGSASSGNRWAPSWPALLRTSFIQYPPDGIDIDNGDEGAGNFDSSLANKAFFLYPRDNGAPTMNIGASASRNNINCHDPDDGEGGFRVGDSGVYDCRVTISGINPAAGPVYLQLAALYKGTDYSVELLDGAGEEVPFDNVSPEIDSTGAAGNVFRRVKVRVQFDSRQPMLPNAVDIGGSLCKNFRVSSTPVALSTAEICSAP